MNRPTKLLHIDGAAYVVPEPVWSHVRFLSAQLSSMAQHATKQAARVRDLEREIDGEAAA